MLSTDNKNSKILALAISALIVGVEAQTIANCGTSSPQCCWVVRSWQLMGRPIPTGISSTDNSCCTKPMPGVICDSTNKVTNINWHTKTLTGSIPDEIGKLTSLERLRLDNNQLNGPIPSWIGNLAMLNWLELDNNSLSGSIPKEIGNLVKLTYLHLSNNQLSGSVPTEFKKLINLQYLYLSSNQISGSIPSEIGNLIKLERVYFSKNQLSGSIPSSIGKLISLNYLSLRSNQLSGSIPSEIGNLINLITLNIFDNKLSGTLPLSIGNLINLQSFSIYNNTGLSGTLTPNCLTEVSATNTQVTLCGCATAGSPPVLFPPTTVPVTCLATGKTTKLTKRAQLPTQSIGSDLFTCNYDTNGNPFQDCLNLQAAFCNSSYIKGNQDRINICKKNVDDITRKLSTHWQDVRKSCGQWPFDNVRGSPTSSACIAANIRLEANAKYYMMIEGSLTEFPVTAALTDSVKQFLWGNTEIK